MNRIEKEVKKVLDKITDLEIDEQISIINNIKKYLHEISPFKNEPVDCVLWVKSEEVVANEYNPNKVAPPEMELLEISITNDGYTQPVVTFQNEKGIEVVDGFHRSRVGKESSIVRQRTLGYLPTVEIRKEQSSKNDRIASTIRHNRARGKHVVDAMSEIVLELKNRNWKNSRIARELGMDEEEILRLCQISGLEDIFKDDDFSKAWEIGENEDEFIPLTDDITDEDKQEYMFNTTPNTSDPDRIFHTFDKWECHKAGFYKKILPDNVSKDNYLDVIHDFFADENIFSESVEYVINNWKHSCEQYLTNKAMNRIAWLGQAALCYKTGIPSEFRSGFNLLSDEEKEKANNIAHEFLNDWLFKNEYDTVSYFDAIGGNNRQMEIY